MNKFRCVGSTINKVQSINRRHLFEWALYFYLTEKDVPFLSFPPPPLTLSLSLACAKKKHRTAASVVTGIASWQYSKNAWDVLVIGISAVGLCAVSHFARQNFDWLLTADYLAILYKLEQWFMNRERCVSRKLTLEQMMNINGTPLLDFQQQTLWICATLGFDGRSAL